MMRVIPVLLLCVTVAAGAQEVVKKPRVKMPLGEYLQLVERAEANERVRANQVPTAAGPQYVENISEKLDVRLEEGFAACKASYVVELRGKDSAALDLPFACAVSKVSLTPSGQAAVDVTNKGLRMMAFQPGRYTVEVEGVLGVQEQAGQIVINLARTAAPVAITRLDLPGDRTWSSAGATIAREEVVTNRRFVELAYEPGRERQVLVRREVKVGEGEKTLAKAVVVTIVTLRPEGVRRHDVVFYEVSRGKLAQLSVDLPPSFEVDRLATDEGEITPMLEGRKVIMGRTEQLTGIGYAVITSAIVPPGLVSLAPVVPEVEVRARYLVYTTSVACELAPRPRDKWQRVDLGDLPEAIRSVSEHLKLSATWQGVGDSHTVDLEVLVLPATPMLDTLIRLRETTTLLTVEGTLMHKDRFVLAQAGSSLELELPPDGTLWSAEVDGLPVRTLDRNGKTLIPLALGVKPGTSISTVVVQKRVIPEGRSELDLVLPATPSQVIQHSWRLLLPEKAEYRYVSGTLTPLAPEAFRHETGTIRGMIVDKDGRQIRQKSIIVFVSRSDAKLLRVGQTNENGMFEFSGLELGRVRVWLYPNSGYVGQTWVDVVSSAPMQITISAARVTSLGDFPAGAVVVVKNHEAKPVQKEEVVPIPSPSLSSLAQVQEQISIEASVDDGWIVDGVNSQNNAYAFSDLRQSVTAGVKPVPVNLPEGGKGLLCVGALPPIHIEAKLAVKLNRQ